MVIFEIIARNNSEFIYYGRYSKDITEPAGPDQLKITPNQTETDKNTSKNKNLRSKLSKSKSGN